jgi:hypothetical protein
VWPSEIEEGNSRVEGVGADAPVVEELVVFLAFFLALGVLTVVLLALLDAAAEVLRQRLLTRRDLRRRFGKWLRTRPSAVEEVTQELALEDTQELPEDAQELAPVQRPRRRFSR